MTGVLVCRPDADRDEWLEARQAGIGASEIAAVLGISPYDSPFSLWWRKRNNWGVDANAEMSTGTFLEGTIASWFKVHGDPNENLHIDHAGLYHHPDRPWQMLMPHADPTVRAAYMRQYKRDNRWRFANWQRTYDSTKHANERAVKYGAAGVLALEEVVAIFKAGQCHYCGSSRRLGLDHVVPLHQKGPNRPENIVLSCHSCNASKWRVEEPWQWSRKHDRCIDCSTTERRHVGHGLCAKCYARWSWYVRRGARQWPRG